jgi:mannose-1-phosphate guanylyltransferase
MLSEAKAGLIQEAFVKTGGSFSYRPGYGCILPSDPLEIYLKACQVEIVTKKSSPAAARDIITRGGLWNTFVMIFKLSRMLELVREIAPGAIEEFAEICDSPGGADAFYSAIQPWNFPTQVLARNPYHLRVLRVANLSWSDCGTRESVERTYQSLNLVPSWKLAKVDECRPQVHKQTEDLSAAGEQRYATHHPR